MENSKIEWTDHTFNPWIGCQHVSPGCDHCYAETQSAFRKWNGGTWGPHAPRKRTSEENWKNPVKWNAEAREFKRKHGRRPRVFGASLADVSIIRQRPLGGETCLHLSGSVGDWIGYC
jgi:protein gp37